MKKNRLLILFVLMWGFVGINFAHANYSAGQLPAFELTDSTSKTVKLSDLEGKIWIANFIFTQCGHQCPMLTQTMKRLVAHWGSKEQVAFVSFSVDPTTDTPQVLSTYQKKQQATHPRWHFLTGPETQMRTLLQEGFYVASQKKKKGLITHSPKFVLVGKKGEILGYYNAMEEEEAFKKLNVAIETELKSMVR